MSQIYLDHAASTAVHPAVLEAMMPYFCIEYYNPSSGYQVSKNIKNKIEDVRAMIASGIQAQPEEIYFTSGGTEADNWFLHSVFDWGKQTQNDNQTANAPHIITSAIEHHAVLNTCHRIEQAGGNVTYLPVNKYGLVNVRELEQSIQNSTSAISIQFANNEIGTIQPIGMIGQIAEKYRIPFHTDAVQACGHIPIRVKNLKIRSMSASAHKFQGPKGIGFLYVDKRQELHQYICGGKQERGYRAGTENVPGIIGMGKAFELALSTMERRRQHEMKLRDYLLRRIMQEIPYTRINGHMFHRLPNNVNLAFRFVNGASLLVLLDAEEICVSSGSACNADAKSPSHVIRALHLPEEYEGGVIRMTLGEENTIEEMEHVVMVLKNLVAQLRKESPEYEDYNLKR